MNGVLRAGLSLGLLAAAGIANELLRRARSGTVPSYRRWWLTAYLAVAAVAGVVVLVGVIVAIV